MRHKWKVIFALILVLSGIAAFAGHIGWTVIGLIVLTVLMFLDMSGKIDM